MPTVRGFVERLEVGRAGLVTLTLLHEDGSRQDYLIPDLDADPERFNEYLSKLALLRDAMDRAEPVEVEYDGKEGTTRGLSRVARITRDQLAGPGKTLRVTASVVGAVIGTAVGAGPHMESADMATIIGMAADGSVQRYVLDMQIPERAVAQAQLAALLRAQEAGATVTLEVTAESLRIVAVGVGDTDEQGSAGALDTIDGFVESIAHSPFATSFSGTAQVMLTTAPPFNGAGNMVPLEPFTPQAVTLLVAAGSAEYKLFVLALADKLRVRVMLAGAARGHDKPTNRVVEGANFTMVVAAGVEANTAKPLLVRGARVLHALCSASRPVWIEVRRRSLDIGPEVACTEGVPTSDLTVQTIRDLHLPYAAEWIGWGCFNHGVYRFQFGFTSAFEILVDGQPLCIHASADGTTRFAHACLEGDHQIRVVLPAWSCAQVFDMDVYRIR